MIAGIDPSSRKLAMVWGSGLRMATHAIGPKPWPARADEAWWWVHQMTRGWPAATVVLESPVYIGRAGARSLIPQAVVGGAVMAALETSGHEVVLTAPSEWKKYVLGRGNASKVDIAAWLHDNHHDQWEQCAGDQDLMDACCMWHYALSVNDHQQGDGPGPGVERSGGL